MLVLNLACEQGHTFEGWFASADDFSSQEQRGLLSCPVCNSAHVTRRPSAPRLNLSGPAQAAEPRPRPAPAPEGSPANALPQALQAQLMQGLRQLMAATEDVGARFAEEARRIHYGEAPERAIRWQATREEARDLAEEGIDIVALPLPAALKEPLQ